MLHRLIQPAASAVSGATRIAVGRTHAPAALSAAASMSRFGVQPPSAAVVPQPAGLSARGFSASAILHVGDGVSAGGGNGINNDEPAAAAPVGTKTRVLWVQRVGAKSSAPLAASGDVPVGYLLEDIQKKLPSLRDVDADSITVQLAVKGAGGTDKLVALDSMDTVDEALTKALGGAIKLTDKLRIIVDVAAPAATTAPAAAAAPAFPRSVADMTPLDDTHHISRVVAAIRCGLVTAHADGHLLLPADLVWPVASNNVLFVRKFAAPLFESVLNQCMPVPGESMKRQRRIVTGQPGIGKSVWAWYVIYRVLKEQPERTVIYASSSTNNVFVIPPSGPVRQSHATSLPLNQLEFMPDLGENPLLVADSLLPPPLPFPTLVVSSPGRLADRSLNDRLNSYFARVYIPVPTADDVLTLNALASPPLDEKGVKERMELWGPIPRHVLIDCSREEQLDLWKRVQGVSLDALVALARAQASSHGGGDELDARHRIVHERAAGQDAEPGTPAADPTRVEFYARGAVTIASPSLLRWIAERLIEEKKWDAAHLIDASVGIGALGALRGIKFEEAVLAALEEGCELACLPLADARPRGKADAGAAASAPNPNPNSAAASAPAAATPAATAADDAAADSEGSTRRVLAAPRVTWTTGAELAQHKGVRSLLVPSNRNVAGLDALIWDDSTKRHLPLDCTVSKQHGLHAQGLADAVMQLGWSPDSGWPRLSSAKSKQTRMQIKYFWAVPEDVFKKRIVRQLPKKGSNETHEAKAAYEHVQQYALCVPPQLTITRVASACRSQGVRLPAELLHL